MGLRCRYQARLSREILGDKEDAVAAARRKEQLPPRRQEAMRLHNPR